MRNDSKTVSGTQTAKFPVLGIAMDAVQIPDTIAILEDWIARRDGCRYVAVTGMHGISEAVSDPTFRAALNAASLLVCDGMPLVWLGRWHGHALRRRVYGPELMDTFCRVTGARYRHFFYGGAQGVPEHLANVMQSRHGIHVAGAYSPPFRPLTAEEDKEVLEMIEASRADVLWIGLSTPKQERWMHEHRDKLTVPVVLGVGAAFDLNIGRLSQAPVWMRENGLEWLYRLLAEPRRLWRRYLINGPIFLWNVSLELMSVRKFD
ncbi:MAG TPA: WecB/TagA/CpsF family glycosyltransferase [Terriglobales bacterium]|nr:WecB/TagA/CpsF family glycosyltransferase [Terriglobales bacterium]